LEFGLLFGSIKFTRLTALFEPLITMSVKDDANPNRGKRGAARQLDTVAFERATAGR
jgi:hypothetical protein